MKISDKAKSIYNKAIVIDNHLALEVNMPLSFEEKWRLVDEAARCGVTAISLSLANEETRPDIALQYLGKVRNHIFSHPEKYILATKKNDIVRAKKENKIAIRLMFQATAPIYHLDLVNVYAALGISSLTLAYNIKTNVGNGIIEEKDDGLSVFGEALIHEMNTHAMLVDGSHAGVNTVLAALKITKKPFIISHSGVYGVHAHPRNARDEQIKAVAKTGGIIGINGLGVLLGDPNASIAKYVDHIDYVVNLVGPEYVGIGLDQLYFADQFLDFMKANPVTHPGAYANIVKEAATWNYLKSKDLLAVTQVLLDRGYDEKSIQMILGENSLGIVVS